METDTLIEKRPTAGKKDFPGSGKSRAEAIAWGRSLRNKTSRGMNSEWVAPLDRKDPVEVLIQSSEGRAPELIPIRYGRMLQSPFTFYRGAASIMAADLANTPKTGLVVQSCGDCHLLNFGTYATPERRMVFDINDFDETLPAPWEWDLKRLATSFVIAGEQNRIGKNESRDAARQCVNAYRAHIAEYAELNPLEVWYSSIPIESVLENSKSEDVKKRVAKKIEKARNRTLTGEDYPKLTEPVNGRVRIKDNPPLIYHRVDVNSAEYHHLVQEAFTRYCDTLGEEKRIMIDQYKIVDIAAKVVGIGSVGTLCSIILMMTYDNEVLFLQVKEARTSVMEPFAGRSLYKNNGQRVVSGQKLMQAATDVFLGWTELPNGKHYFIRQLRDMKIKPSVELYDAEVMSDYAALCGWTLARAHARSGKAAVISGYLGSSEKFDDAIAEFGVQYAEQNERDYNALMNAVRSGKLEAYFER